MEVPTEVMRRVTIRSNWNIGAIESTLKGDIESCEIWGDLNLSTDEYNNIKASISNVLGYDNTASGIRTLFRNYPVTMVTDIINFVLFEFDNNDFWSSWANRFGISLSINHHTEIGCMVREIFKKYKFDIIEDGGYTYVTPILCQAGIPCTCFNKLFDILDSTLNTPYFVNRELVDELRGYRNYLIDAPVERYFRLHTERSVDLIAGLRDMMHSLGGSPNIDNYSLPSFAGVETRITRQYVEWRAESKSRGYKRIRSEQYFNPPKLVYDNCKGVCILLPGQVLRQDTIYKLQWKITCDDGLRIINDFSQVYNIDGRNCTNEKNVPVDFASNYKIELFDDDDATKPLTSAWYISGIKRDNPVLVFNELGALGTNKFISRKGTVVVFDSRQTNMSDRQGVQELMAVDLPKSWPYARAFKVYPAERRASITLDTYGDKIKIECKNNFEYEFVQAGTLFDEKFTPRETPVFIKFPTIEVSGYIEQWNKSSFDKWQVSITHRLSNTRHTVMLSEIDIVQNIDSFHLKISDYTSNYFSGLYGAYEIKVYDGIAKRDLSFYLAPAIQYSGIVESLSEEISHSVQKSGFYFKDNDSVEIEFEDGVKVIPTLNRGNGWKQAITESKGALINGQIIYEYAGNKYSIQFKKTIRKLQWQFWNETKNEFEAYGTKLFFSNQLQDEKWRLALRITDTSTLYDSCKLVLESSCGEPLQNKELTIDREGNCIVTMNLFQDTLMSHRLPQRLMLHILKDDIDISPICLAVIRNFVELRNPRFALSKEQPIIYWDRGNDLGGKKLKLRSLSDPEMEVAEYPLDSIKNFHMKDGTKYEGLIIKEVLPDGVYHIDAVESEEGFFFEDDIESTICTFEKERMLFVNGKQLIAKLLSKDDASLFEWLSACVVALYKAEWVDKIIREMQEKIEKQQLRFDTDKCTSLLFFLLFATNNKSDLDDKTKEQISEICEAINLWCITDYDRSEILKYLVDSKIDENDCRFIIESLQLYLFKTDGTVLFHRRCMQKIWGINESIAVLANLRKCTADISTDLLRVSNYINTDSFGQFVRFAPNPTCKTSEWLDCFEKVLSGKCNCNKIKFECSKRVWGDGFEWSKLFTKVKNNNYDIIPPEESHTDGYEIIGSNYLTLIYNLFTKRSDETSFAEKAALQETYKVENLASKYNPYFADINSVLRRRMGDGGSLTHKLFYLIGIAAILEALASSREIDYNELQEIRTFWKNAMKAYPKLVYRDLIVAELNIKLRNERGN